MNTDKLRTAFLDFFKSREHQIFSSDSLVPGDRTVLFTSAGMNQFKPYFLGEKAGVNRAASAQKCLRTGDLDRVGKTDYHHTFFEMLGNFSFGDYFKKEAISFAWEFITGTLNIPQDKIWISVYRDDQRSFSIWKDYIGISPQKIVKLGTKSNFWPADAPLSGPDGPCGPCSEIFFDRGEDKGCGNAACGPDCSCGRFVEMWNLVFTQYDRTGKNQLKPLPQKNIDTGMGLERVAAVLQEKKSNFQIDILWPVVKTVREYLKTGSCDENTASLVNAVVDYARAATFAIGDGVYPSNEGRGYVIRKLIRKASWNMSLLGKQEAFIHKLPFLFAELMGGFYPEIDQKKEIASRVIKSEELKFLSTLQEGKTQVLAEIHNLKKNKQKSIGADKLFRFYDTYGLPCELSREIAREHGLDADLQGFNELIVRQQELSRKKSMFADSIFAQQISHIEETSQFLGYDCFTSSAEAVKIFSGNEDGRPAEEVDVLREGEQGAIVLNRTPFYPESGGQLTDRGSIRSRLGVFTVDKVIKIGKAIIHQGIMNNGEIRKGKVEAAVDKERRNALARAHTATHLLQAALRNTLGEHVCQQGSLVNEDRLRFDFTHFEALPADTLADVENRVNSFIFREDEVTKRSLTLEEAKAEGALAFFQDKYEEEVRMICIGDYSKELCSGTHLGMTSQVGGFVILSESSISSGIRRIEALAGKKANEYLRHARDIVCDCSSLVQSQPDALKGSLTKITEELKTKHKTILMLARLNLRSLVKKVVAQNRKDIAGVCFVSYVWEKEQQKILQDESLVKDFVDTIKETLGDCFVFVVYQLSGRNRFICSAGDNIVEKGFSCRKFVSLFGKALFLKGGGKDSYVQGVVTRLPGNFSQEIEQSFTRFVRAESGNQ